MLKSEETDLIPLLRTRSALDISQDIRQNTGKIVDENTNRSKSVIINGNMEKSNPIQVLSPISDSIDLEELMCVSEHSDKTSVKDVSSEIGSQVSIDSRASSKNKNTPSKIPIAIKYSVTKPTPSSRILHAVLSSKTSGLKCAVQKSNGALKDDMCRQYNMKIKRLSIVKKNMQEKQNRLADLYKTITAMRAEIFENTKKKLPIEEIEFKICSSEKDFCHCNCQDINLTDEEAKKNININLQEITSSILAACYKMVNESCNIFHEVLAEVDEIDVNCLMANIEKRKEELRVLESNVITEINANETAINVLLEKISSITKLKANTENDDALILLKKKLEQTEANLKQTEADLEVEIQNTIQENEKVKKNSDQISTIMKELENLADNLYKEKSNIDIYKEQETKAQHKLNVFYVELDGLSQQQINFEKKIQDLTNNIKSLENEWKNKEEVFVNENKKLQENIIARKDYAAKIKNSRQNLSLQFLYNIALYFLYDLVTSDIYF